MLVVVKLVDIVMMLSGVQAANPVVEFLGAYAGWKNLIRHPWGVVTYMFLHQGFLHILFNLLWLFWFGRIFLQPVCQPVGKHVRKYDASTAPGNSRARDQWKARRRNSRM